MKPSSKAENFESATGEKSVQRIAQERGHGIIKNAASWAELHEGLQKVGLRFEKKGSGAIIFVGDIAAKPSSIDRNFGLSKLYKRLGEFEPGQYSTEMKPPEPESVSALGLEEWREYRKLKRAEAEKRHEHKTRRAVAIAQARAEQRGHRRTASKLWPGMGCPC